MAYPQYTPNQSIRYPVSTDSPDVPTHLLNSITDLEGRLVQRFVNVTDRSNRVPSPVEGMLSALQTEGRLDYYDGSGWQTVYPPTSHQSIGTSIPADAVGGEGDVFYLVS